MATETTSRVPLGKVIEIETDEAVAKAWNSRAFTNSRIVIVGEQIYLDGASTDCEKHVALGFILAFYCR